MIALADRAAAAQQQQLVAAGIDVQHRLQIERLALVLLPYILGYENVARRRIAQFARDPWSVAIEVKQQGSRIIAEAV